MVAFSVRISDDLKCLIDSLQTRLEYYIVEHHNLFQKFQHERNYANESKLRDVQKKIHGLGVEQKKLVARIRLEVKSCEKNIQTNGIKQAYSERVTSINNAIHTARLRKQNMQVFAVCVKPSTHQAVSSVARVISVPPSPPPDPVETPSGSSSPEPVFCPSSLKDVTQNQYLKYFGLVTHAVHEEMQKKRVERKRRSTANPQFFYGSKGWDLPKRKRAAYLISNCSPPNTRLSAKIRAKAERVTPPTSKDNSRGSSPIDTAKLYIPNLPNGLIIEPVNPNRASPDNKICVVCRLTDSIMVCESCMNGFHIECHNRPLVETPRKCPKCLTKPDVRTVGSLTVPSGMSVFVSSDFSEKLQEKQNLLEENKSLIEELDKLQDQHEELTISLKDQKVAQDELLVNQRSTQDKIKDILDFISLVKSPIRTAIQSS